MEAAWQRYRQTLEDARVTLYEWELIADPAVRNAAHYGFHQIQANAFNMVIAPRQDYPSFQIHSFAEPMFYSWALNNPDFLYRMVYLDGARTYRIWGRRHDTLWLDFQVFSRFWSAPESEMHVLANYDLDKFQLVADGTFEIIASATSQAGNWIKLDKDAPRHAVMLRETFVDWGKETAAELHIETIDGLPSQPVVHSEAEMIERIDGAARLISFVVRRFMVGTVTRGLANFGRHVFYSAPSGNSAGTNPVAHYWQCIYQLEPDEALIVDTEIPKCKYWGIQMTDVFVQTTEYVHHQSSLNSLQARLDKDGRFRAVISKQDPMVQNWLDPVDNLQGMVFLRWYLTETNPSPTVNKIKFVDIHQHLPTDTPSVSPEERAASLRARRIGALRRYGY
jgi:hypothetical protein